jgi:predicted phosphoribosyltransferase
MERYIDRYEAGTILAEYLKDYANQTNVIVLALPRGGVPVAYEIATALSIPLDIFIVRKLGVPGHEELAMGAIASGGTVVFNEPLMNQLNIEQMLIDAVLASEQKELVRRELLYRGNRPFPNLAGKKIILVDDGIATGSTMLAAVKALTKHKPASIIIAVPVAERSTCEELEALVDKIVCPLTPINFYAVGLWYEQFPQTSDSEVIELLKQSNSMSKRSR